MNTINLYTMKEIHIIIWIVKLGSIDTLTLYIINTNNIERSKFTFIY